MEPKREWETAAGFRVRSTLLAGRQARVGIHPAPLEGTENQMEKNMKHEKETRGAN